MDKFLLKQKNRFIFNKRDFKIALVVWAFLFFPCISYSQIGLQQAVDISCNENLICEPDLFENFDTCPLDCHLVSPINYTDMPEDVIIAQINIFNLEVLVGIGGTAISWETNKPTATSLILSDALGEIKKGYIDESYLMKHRVIVDSFVFKEDFYFKIFARGIYGDNNYDDAELFIIKQGFQEPVEKIDFTNKEQIDMENNLIISGDSVSSKTIKLSEEELNQPITLIDENNDKFVVLEFIETNLNIFKNTSVGSFVFEFFGLILIAFGILFFTFLLINNQKK